MLLNDVKILVIDEADRMLDMGFINDIKRIVAVVPKQRQTLLFSATLPPAVRNLRSGILDNPVEVSVTPSATTLESITQSVYLVEKNDKPELLIKLLAQSEISRALVFTRTKHGADKVVRKLTHADISAAAIHGNKSQNQRERALQAFGRGRSRVLVATDIASRGLDIDDVSHVVNFDLPHDSESYVHRIGRTGRAGATGVALSFCACDERDDLRAIEKLIRMPLPVEKDHPFHSERPASPAAPPKRATYARPRRGAPRRNSGGGGSPRRFSSY